MGYFVLTDNDGKPLAFFNSKVHGERMRNVVEVVDGKEVVTGAEPNPDCAIPDAAVAITEEQWCELMEYQGLRKLVSGSLVELVLPVQPPTQEDYSAAIQSLLDANAKERQYDGIHTAIGYRDDPNPAFAAEALTLFNWRSAVWTYSSAELAKVMAGERAQPTVAEFMSELEAACPFTWPMKRAAMLGGQLSE